LVLVKTQYFVTIITILCYKFTLVMRVIAFPFYIYWKLWRPTGQTTKLQPHKIYNPPNIDTRNRPRQRVLQREAGWGKVASILLTTTKLQLIL
jgi:hypothetical protein